MIDLRMGDCLELLKSIPDESVDLVFTDPPYNISSKTKLGRKYESGEEGDVSFNFGEWDYDFDPIPFLTECKRVLKPEGSIIVWTSEQLFAKYRVWFAENMYPKQLLVWVKTNPLPQFRKVSYRQATELMYWASKEKMTQDNPNFIFTAQQDMTNVFYAPVVSGEEKTEHPTQKPLSITMKIIKTHCREGGVVLDPFMGSGTTGVGCVKTNRNFIGFEIDKEYFELAQNRIKKEIQGASESLI